MLSHKIAKTLFTLLLLLSRTFLLAQDGEYQDDGDFTPFLFGIGIVFLSVAGGVFAAGFLLVMGITGLAVLLTAIGILSSSFLVAMHTRSLMTGFKTFLYLLFPLLGGITGAAFFLGISTLFKLNLPYETDLLVGAMSGIAGGLLLAFITVVITRNLGKMLFRN